MVSLLVYLLHLEVDNVSHGGSVEGDHGRRHCTERGCCVSDREDMEASVRLIIYGVVFLVVGIVVAIALSVALAVDADQPSCSGTTHS